MKPKSLPFLITAFFVVLFLWLNSFPRTSDHANTPNVTTTSKTPSASSEEATSSPQAQVTASKQPASPDSLAWTSPRDWSNANVLQEERLPVSGKPHQYLRRRLIETPDFTFPIILEELIEEDSATGQPLSATPLAAMVAHQLIIDGGENLVGEDFFALAESIGWRVQRQNETSGWAVIQAETPSLETITQALSTLNPVAQQTGFKVEPNYIVYALATPNDKRFDRGEQWGLNNTQNEFDINAPEGWEIRTDARATIVAIIDSGILLNHKDLQQNLWTNQGEIAGNGIDDDRNGFVDDVHGFNFIKRTGSPNDDNGHGTHVAGIIGASGNNGKGIAGVAWQARLMGLKFLNGEGRGTIADAIDAINYAGKNGARIINASWGGSNYSSSLESAISQLRARGVIVVAAAGNSGRDIDSVPTYPAALETDNIVTVASMNRIGYLSYFSNYGISRVDLAAPGEGIMSCWISETDAYTKLSGTSMAAPMVSGILALNAAHRPNEDYLTLIDRISYTASVREDFATKIRTSGFANLHSSLALVNVPYPPRLYADSPSRQSLIPGESAMFEVSVSSRSDSQIHLQWLFNDVEIEGANEATFRIESTTEQSKGRYTLRARNDDGLTSLHFIVWMFGQDDTLAAALDAPSSVSVLVARPEMWQVIESPESTGGSHVGLPFENHESESDLYSEVQGAGVIRFKWRLPEVWYHGLNVYCTFDDIHHTYANSEWTWVERELTDVGSHRIRWSVTGNTRSPPTSPYLVEIDALQFHEIGKVPPQIVNQLTDQRVALNNEIHLSLYALGDNLLYQWYKDSIPIQGATGNSLRIKDVSENDAGAYHVVVSNEYGSQTSGHSEVTIVTEGIQPFFTERGDTHRYTEGDVVEFSFKHGGSQPMTYQWFKEDYPIPGATNPTLLLDPISAAHAGRYQLKISNEHWTYGRYSDRFSVYVDGANIPPKFFVRPDYLYQNVANLGNYSAIGFQSPGSGEIEYQWFKNDEPFDGPDSWELTFDSVSIEDRGVYYLEARNALGLAQSHRTELIVKGGAEQALDYDGGEWDIGGFFRFATENSDPDFTYDGLDCLSLSSTYDQYGHSESVSLTLTGPINLRFHWKQSEGTISSLGLLLDGDEIQFAKGTEKWERATVHVPAGEHTLEWIHHIRQKGDDAWIDLIQETDTPVFTDLFNFTVPYTDSGALLRGNASGLGTIAYQWFKNGNPINGQTQATLSVEEASPDDIFQVKAYSEYGEILSLPIRVVPTSSITGESPYPITLGGEGEWTSTLGFYEDNSDGKGTLLANLQPGDTASLSFESDQASIFAVSSNFYLFYSVEATFNGEPLVLNELNDAWQSGYSHFVSIPQGTGIFLFKVKSLRDTPITCYFEKISILPSPSILLLPGDHDPLNNINTELQMTFGATSENTVKWYRNGELFLTEQSPDNYNSLPFGHIYGSPQKEDAGTYYCEVIDAYGNTVQSERFEVIPHQYPGEIIDYEDVGAYSDNTKQSVDYQEGILGGSSLRFEVPPKSVNTTVNMGHGSIYTPSLLQPVIMQMKSSSSNIQIYLSDERNNDSLINVPQDWQSIELLFAENSSIRLRFENTGDEVEYVWLDSVQVDDRLQMVSHPKNYGTYLGGPATLTALAVPQSGTSYQWFHNGETIAGATDATFKLDNTQRKDLGSYTVNIYNNGETLQSDSAEISLIGFLGEAIEQPGLKISTSGDAFWSIDKSTSIDGSWSLRSGELDYGESSTLRIDFDYPGMIHYYNFLDSPKDSFHQQHGLQSWYGQNVTRFEGETFIELTVSMDPYNRENSNTPHTMWIDRLSFQPVPLTHYSNWAVSKESGQDQRTLSGSLLDPSADSDNDGMINLFEFALNLDPFTRSQPPTIYFEQEGKTITGNIIYEFAPHSDYNVYLETSTNGKQWDILNPEIINKSPATDPLYNTIHARFQIEIEEGQLFLARWHIAGTGTVNAPISRIGTN